MTRPAEERARSLTRMSAPRVDVLVHDDRTLPAHVRDDSVEEDVVAVELSLDEGVHRGRGLVNVSLVTEKGGFSATKT